MTPSTNTSSSPSTSVAVIANAKPGKAPRKVAAKKTVIKAKTAKKAAAVKAPVSGKALKVFCSDFGLTPKQARVVLRKAWRGKDAGLLHSLRNRWIFDKAQETKARAVFKAVQKARGLEAIESADEGDDE